MRMLFRILFIGLFVVSQIKLMSGDGKGLVITLDFRWDIIHDEQITEILQEGILEEYSEFYLMDYACSERVFIHPDILGKSLEINVNIICYPDNFKSIIASIFNYFAKGKIDVVLNFWVTRSNHEKILYGCLSWKSDGSLRLDWVHGPSGTSVEGIIFRILKNNLLIRRFVYGSCEQKPENCALLRSALLAFKEQIEWCNLTFIDRRMQPKLCELCLPNHLEVSSKTLIELLDKGKIRELDISQWKLTEKELEELLEYLSGYLSLKKLYVAGNRIHDKALHHLGSLVACNISLEELDMGFLENRLTLQSIKNFLAGINEKNSTLKKIFFGDTEITEEEWETSVIGLLRKQLPNCQIKVCFSFKKHNLE